MTPHQIDLINETWISVASLGETAAQLFYKRLFEIDPGTQALFAQTDMTAQNAKLLEALGFVVESAEHADRLLPVLQELGRRHVSYGVENHHYESVGAALLWTLEQGLGPAFTDDVRDAWTAAYTLVADTMMEAARSAGEELQAPGRAMNGSIADTARPASPPPAE